MCPSFLEEHKVLLKAVKYVTRVEIVCLELLDYHENEKVQHNEGTKHHVRNEEDGSVGCPTSLPIDTAILVGEHSILHDIVPVLPCGHTYQKKEGAPKVGEVVHFVNGMALSDVLEEECA
jgi:hypothetical protein